MGFEKRKHTLAQELAQVHDQMIDAYNLERAASIDSTKAIKMEQYLRTFKALGDWYKKDSTRPGFQTDIDDLAYEAIALEVGQRMGLGQKEGNSLFRWSHGATKTQNKEWGVDDVFEAELTTLLQAAAEVAVGKQLTGKQTLYSGAQTVGQLAGNVAASVIEALDKEKLVVKAINKTTKASKLTKKPEARAIKTDIKGYNANFSLRADIKEEWREFIDLFTGVNLSVKNYSNKNANYTTIHLGNTVPAKSIPAVLNYSGYSPIEAAHIYAHILKSESRNTERNSQHILHLRFAYELTGGGLTMEDGGKEVPLEAVDFLIYNDPNSSNIWVRSTKEMLSQMTKYLAPVADALQSPIVILKSSFT